MDSFTGRELEYLRAQHLGRLATVRPDGTVQNNPVGFGFNDKLGTIDISGHDMAASRKFKNVAAGSSVAFVVDDLASVNPWAPRCIEIRGEAEALVDPEDSAGQWSGPIIRIHPRWILSFGVDPEAQRLRH
ncbi:PPOX class F420-dependent oxidoreductase [Nocardia sp. ET3-3]|uniref:PPOX class F420-dependent oxidoreductase n=1 Tax=Nocardia terrae TaxID=2675851 RepID=A0A7K1V955_9NOCA|nr:PPOX class F420-dependent oxidoreductase [Nocardia terrae]MVU83175.1 PPOX class F420-dependent oxidoreductase [Nocardia terrae]